MAVLTRRSVLVGLSAFGAMPAAAQSSAWPNRPITMVHGLPPGGSVDGIVRIISEGLATRLGQQVVVDARPAWLNGFNGGPMRQPSMRVTDPSMATLRTGLARSGIKADGARRSGVLCRPQSGRLRCDQTSGGGPARGLRLGIPADGPLPQAVAW